MKKISAFILAVTFAFSLVTVQAVSYDTSRFISKQGWKITASDTKAIYPASNAIDGNKDSYWHSNYDESGGEVTSHVECPHDIVITLPEETTISGFGYLPRQGNITGSITAYEFYGAEKEGAPWQLLKSGAMEENLMPKYVELGKNVTVKMVKLVATSSNKGYALVAEFDLIGKSEGTTFVPGASEFATATGLVDKSGWSSSASSTYGDLVVSRIIDGDVNSYWHSGYQATGSTITSKDEAPFYILMTFPEKTMFSGFRYSPRVDNYPGTALKYEFYVCDEKEGQAELINSGNFELTLTPKDVDFGYNISGKSIIFVITEGKGGYGTCSEFDLFAKKGSYTEKTIASAKTPGRELIIADKTVTDPNAANKITSKDFVGDKSGWTVKASSETELNPAKYAVDGAISSFWHTAYTANERGEILTKETEPHKLLVMLPSDIVISGFSYTPRAETSGRVTRYSFYASDSDDGELQLITTNTFENTGERKDVRFPMNIKIKRFELVVLQGVNGYAAVCELDLHKEKGSLKTAGSIAEVKMAIDDMAPVMLSKKGFTASSSSEMSAAISAVDGSLTTAWHSANQDQHKFPIILTIDMGTRCSFSALQYTPRNVDDTHNGVWEDFDINISDDGESYAPLAEKQAFDLSGKTQTVDFGKVVTTRFMQIYIRAGHNGFATCSELDFVTTKDKLDEAKKQNYYSLQIGSNIVTEYKDGVKTETEMDVAPFIMGGYTLIPLRGLLEQMGATVDWEAKHQQISIFLDDNEIYMQAYNNLVDATHPVYGLVRYTLQVVPQIKNSRTFVPVRFISEQLGHEVEWVPETKTINIY